MMKYLLLATCAFTLYSCNGQQTSNASKPERSVSSNILVSNMLPEIEIKVENEFEYVGSFSLRLLQTRKNTQMRFVARLLQLVIDLFLSKQMTTRR